MLDLEGFGRLITRAVARRGGALTQKGSSDG